MDLNLLTVFLTVADVSSLFQVAATKTRSQEVFRRRSLAALERSLGIQLFSGPRLQAVGDDPRAQVSSGTAPPRGGAAPALEDAH